MYDKKSFTWGTELEWGDVDRTLELPSELGSWNLYECEILNLRPPYAGIAADPLGVNPPVGGEINVKPSHRKEVQVERILALAKFFEERGGPPTLSCVQGLHVHVHVPGLREDLEALRRISRYFYENQDPYIERLHGFYRDPLMGTSRKAVSILGKSARRIPEWRAENLEKAQSVGHFFRTQQSGKDGWKLDAPLARPVRYSINLYSLKNMETIEYRAPRATLDPKQLTDLFEFLERFTEAALAPEGVPAGEILSSREWSFATFNYNPYQFEAWERTCKTSPSSKPPGARVFYPPSTLTE